MYQYGTDWQVAEVTDGNFNFLAVYCEANETFQLRGVDSENMQISAPQTYTLTSPVPPNIILIACTSIEEYISYSIDGAEPVLFLENINVTVQDSDQFQPALVIGAYHNNDWETGVYVRSWTAVPGTYNSDLFVIESAYVYNIEMQPDTLVFELSHVGNAGEFIDLDIHGTFVRAGVVHTLSYTAHVRRDE